MGNDWVYFGCDLSNGIVDTGNVHWSYALELFCLTWLTCRSLFVMCDSIICVEVAVLVWFSSNLVYRLGFNKNCVSFFNLKWRKIFQNFWLFSWKENYFKYRLSPSSTIVSNSYSTSSNSMINNKTIMSTKQNCSKQK